jgi:hypothetical protein
LSRIGSCENRNRTWTGEGEKLFDEDAKHGWSRILPPGKPHFISNTMRTENEHFWDGTGAKTAKEFERGVRQDMELLIQQKIKRYPEVIRQIVSCELTVVNGKDHIFVASLRSSR